MPSGQFSIKADPERGLRLKKILGKMYPDAISEAALSEKFAEDLIGIASSRSIRDWFKGRNIDNRALAKIQEMGGDICYLLTGRECEVRATTKVDLTEDQKDMLEELSRARNTHLKLLNHAMNDAQKYLDGLSDIAKATIMVSENPVQATELKNDFWPRIAIAQALNTSNEEDPHPVESIHSDRQRSSKK